MPSAATGPKRINASRSLNGLLYLLPRPGSSWTQDDREEFISLFAKALDIAVPVRETNEETP